MGPRTYIRHRRALHHASKPTAIDKITTRPYINPQATSPLFATLPAEIRIEIYHYALLAFPDTTKPYSKHSYWYRPGCSHARSFAVSLLLTCRRVYLETALLPLQLNEHVIWGVERSRIPPGATNYLLDGRLKGCQRNTVRDVHIFCQQFWLEDWKDQWLNFSKSWPEGCMERLRITVRHTDWWYNLLGENSPLALDPKRKGRARVGEWVGEKEGFERGSWGERFQNFKGLRVLELELETTEGKRMELDASVEKAGTWKIPLGDEFVLVLDEEATERTSWTGSKRFKGLNTPAVPAALQLTAQSSRPNHPSPSSTPRSNSETKELSPDDSLDYYVVLLTYHARTASEIAAADAAEAEEAAEAARHEAVDTAFETAIRRTDASAAARAAPAPAAQPRALFNRFNAPPTYYG